MKIAPFMAQLAALVKQRIADSVEPLAREVKALQDSVPTVTKAAVAAAIAEIPRPVDGKSVTADDVRPLIEQLVAAVPPAKDGANADPAVIKAMVDEAVAAIPPAKDGESVAPEAVQAMVKAAVDELPRAKDGASVTVDDVRPLLAEMVTGIEVPVPDVTGPVNEAVAKAVAQIKPKDGQDADPEVTKALIVAEVAKAVAAIPPAPPGRDALQIDVLGAVDVTKGYARGTWAKHAGGLVRAYRNTDPVDGELERAGWEVVVDGVKSTQIEQAGERGFRVVLELTSGQKSAMEWAMPVLLDRGRYSDTKGYEPGDVVDWSGSMWKAETSVTGVEPRPDVTAWRLLVRRGRDGKDAVVRTVEPQRVKV